MDDDDDDLEKSQEKQGLADVMAKILHKNVPSHVQVGNFII